MFIGLVLGLVAIMRLWPTTPIACSLHKLTVETPVSWLSRLERHHLLFVVILTLMLIGGLEVIAALGSFDALLLFSFDLSLYFDAIGALIAIAAAERVKPAIEFIRSRFFSSPAQRIPSKAGGRVRQVRTKRPRPMATNDNEPDRVRTHVA